MPEGDTLAKLAARLRPTLVGARAERVRLLRNEISDPGLDGSRVDEVSALGKHLLLSFDVRRVLVVHLGMHGAVRLLAREEGLASPTEARLAAAGAAAWIETETHRLLVLRPRFVRLLRTDDLARDPRLRALGPDVLADSFDPGDALVRLRAHADVPLGVAILDQRVVAGLGNVWKSELLFRLRLDPFAHVAAFSDEELLGLLVEAHERMRDNVDPLRRGRFAGPRGGRATRRVGESGHGRLAVYGRAGEPCPSCGAVLLRALQGAMRRSTYHCPTCQPSRRSDGA